MALDRDLGNDAASLLEVFAEDFKAAGNTASWSMASVMAESIREALQHAGEGEAEPVAWLLTHPEHGEVLSQHPITDGDRSLGWVDTPLFAAPHPHQAPEGWQRIETAPKDRTPVIIAVPDKDQTGFIVGEAYFDPENNDGDWWWAGTGWGDYHAGPISEINHHLPTHWRPLPVPPASPSQRKGGE